MRLSYSTWGMPTVPIDVAVAHCAELGFDGLEMTVVPRWTTDAAKLDAAERRRFRSYLDLAAELQHPGERLTVSTTSGGVEEDWEATKDVLVERFGALAAYA